MSNYLTGGRVNISLLQESAARDLISLLDKCDGPKVNAVKCFNYFIELLNNSLFIKF